MSESSYRIYLGGVVDVTYSDEQKAAHELMHLANAMDSEDNSALSMTTIDRLSAYIAMNFQNAMFDEVLRMPGIGIFLFDPQLSQWCCSNKRFGSICVRAAQPLNVQGLGLM